MAFEKRPRGGIIARWHGGGGGAGGAPDGAGANAARGFAGTAERLADHAAATGEERGDGVGVLFRRPARDLAKIDRRERRAGALRHSDGECRFRLGRRGGLAAATGGQNGQGSESGAAPERRRHALRAATSRHVGSAVPSTRSKVQRSVISVTASVPTTGAPVLSWVMFT